MSRVIGISAGILNHLLFGVTVYYLYGFLAGWTGPAEAPSLTAAATDFALCLQFAVSHSLLLLPSSRERIGRIIPREFYGTLFCSVTCVSLLLTIGLWKPMEPTLVQLTGWSQSLMSIAFILTWPTLLYSISLTGLGHQTGFTSWWRWVKKEKTPFRNFTPQSLYCWFRHPIYASFLGLLWFTPRITLDRGLLLSLWTTYILVGSVLKDRRLVHYLGDSYRIYQSKVVGYPGFRSGPLGKVPFVVQASRESASQPPIHSQTNASEQFAVQHRERPIRCP